MNTALVRFVALIALGASATVVPATAEIRAVRLFVAPDGRDSHDGTSPARAFASLQRARDEIRHLKAAGPLPPGGVTVELAGGVYPLAKSFTLTEADAGTEGAPIVYRAADGAKVQLLGGRVLDLARFQPVTDPAILRRLDPAARDHVVTLSVPELGLRHAGPFPPVFSDSGGLFELFWDGRRLPLARWPNEGWTTMQRAVVNGDAQTPGTFEYLGDRPQRWLGNPAIWLKGQWRVGWEDPAIRVAAIDPAARTIRLAAGLHLGIGNKYTRPDGNGKEPWCAINLLEEIDRPGEWAVDFTDGRLYLWPPAAAGELIVSQLAEPLISVTGAARVQFIGLTLEGSLGDGIAVERSDAVLIAGCTLRNLARSGIILNGRHCRVESCDLYRLGAGGILVSGGDKATLTPSENSILNNHIHDYGVLKAMYSAAIDVGFGGSSNARGQRVAVGVRVAHNLIHDAPRDAVLVSGQDHVFEYNEIYRCGFASADVGAFYSWLDWTIRGVTIRHNYIHDTVGGVNPDDGASGFTVCGNVFVGPRTGVWIASGPDHVVVNNIFVKDEGPVYGMDDRGVSRGYAKNPKLIEPLEAVKPGQPPWSVRFPEVAALRQNSPELPLRNRFERNLIVMKSGEPMLLKLSAANRDDPRLLQAADNFVTKDDPGFVGAAAGNFALRPDAVAFAKIPGFKPIPFDQIGLQVDRYRRRLPAPEETRRPVPNAPTAEPEKNFGT